MAKRRKAVRTLDDLRAALRELVGPNGSVSCCQQVYDSYSPGSRYESVTWGGTLHVLIDGDPEKLHVGEYDAKSPAELVNKLASMLRQEISERAFARKQRQVSGNGRTPQRLTSPPPKRLKYHPVEK